MKIEKKLLPKIYEQMWQTLKIGLNDAEHYIAVLIEEDHFIHHVMDESDISGFIKKVVEPYFFPYGFDRREVYDIEDLKEQKVNLKEIGKIPDGWDCNLYFDLTHKLYWEDNLGRYSVEGLKISPYMDPIKKYKMS
jgi:hypothetical protein